MPVLPEHTAAQPHTMAAAQGNVTLTKLLAAGIQAMLTQRVGQRLHLPRIR